MEIKIHKEIKERKANVIYGLDLRSVLFVVAAVIVVLLEFFFLQWQLGLDENIMPVIYVFSVAPLGFFGFYKYNNMTAWTAFKLVLRFYFQDRNLKFRRKDD